MGPGLRLRKRLYRLFSNRKLTFTKQCAFNDRFLDFNDIYRVSLIRRITTGPLHRFKRLQILHHFILQKAYEVLHMIEIALQNTGVKFIHFVYIDRRSVAIQLPYIPKFRPQIFRHNSFSAQQISIFVTKLFTVDHHLIR